MRDVPDAFLVRWARPDGGPSGNPMSVLRNLESKIAGLVEGTFGRVFKSEVKPVELARKLAREMDEHKTVSLKRTYVPNEYVIWLSPEDRARYAEMEAEVGDELAAHLLEHSRREKYALVARPQIAGTPTTASARGVRHPGAARAPRGRRPGSSSRPSTGARWSTRARSASRSPRDERRARRGRAFVHAEGKRLPVPAAGAVIGPLARLRHRPGRHERLPPPRGDPPRRARGWTVADLGSTNGVRVNGRPAAGAVPLTRATASSSARSP
jgi:hypothetical protein